MIGDESEIARMTTPIDWPRWPYLPVKRATSDGVVCGFLHADDNPVVYVRNLFDQDNVGKRLGDFPQQRYQSFEALIAAGWVID